MVMKPTCRRIVPPFLLCVAVGLLVLMPSGDAATIAAAERDQAIRSALARGSFPWYDAERDQVRPVDLPAEPDPSDLNKAAGSASWRGGDLLVLGGFAAALVTLIVLVVLSWKRFEPAAEAATDIQQRLAVATAGVNLPLGLRGAGATADPWTEANQRRLAGDLAGAILCLFAHQLLTLARLNLVRLAPGKTGRQLHRAVADAEFQALMTPTLRQFEAVFYGHRSPSAGDFAIVWESAQTFEQRAAAQVTR